MKKYNDSLKRISIIGLGGVILSMVWAVVASADAFAVARDPNELKLWYSKPAVNWDTEALPIGNGRLGAMLFGDIQMEHIQFNEGTLWIGDEQDTGAYQAFGDVFVQFKAQSKAPVAAYRRELDIGRAIHTVTYEQGGIKYRREYFASHPANVMVFRFTADKPGAYSGLINLSDAHQAKITASGKQIMSSGVLEGYSPASLGGCGKSSKPEAMGRPYAISLAYEAQVRVLHEGGTVEAKGGQLVFNQVDNLTLILDAGTNFLQDRGKKWVGPHPHEQIEARLKAAVATPFESMREEHVKDYQRLFNRVALNLGGSTEDIETDRRLANYRAGGRDAGLESLAFQYGRYLLIACSRDTLPATLQGLWNKSNRPFCRCDFHTDINMQMNYWAVDVANTSECFLPFAKWLDSIREVRKEDTRAEFKTRGWTMRGENGLFGGSSWNWVTSCSAWLMQNVWDHYAFTGDKEYLRTIAYPMMKDICEFWVDRLKALPDGTLVAPNGYSPEHGPKREDGVSHDQQLIWELFNNTVEAAATLGIDQEFRDSLTAKRDKLLTPKIGKWGQLQEWMVDRDDPKDMHRHLSHLVAVYPGRQISTTKTPKWAAAATVSLEARGFGGPGWSKAWKISLWARLYNGEHAWKSLNYHLAGTAVPSVNFTGAFYANLLDACPPFQVDGNFGYTAGVCEMLLQSHAGEIALLPALPKAWPQGSVRGLRARGAVTVDMIWNDGLLKTARLTADRDGQYKVRLPGKSVQTVELKSGQPWTVGTGK